MSGDDAWERLMARASAEFDPGQQAEPEAPTGIRIPTTELAPETLRGVIEEFVTRDGTDLFDAGAKIAQVEAQLRRGEIEVWFDEETRTCNLLPAGR